ncbi:MAG: redoxin domain-containing protein [Planctomycetota bacterium]
MLQPPLRPHPDRRPPRLAPTMRVWAALLACGLLAASPSHAQTEVGQAVQTFSLPRVDGQGAAGVSAQLDRPVVLVWQSMRCPWDAARPGAGYQNEVTRLHAAYGDRFDFYAVNSNAGEAPADLAQYAQNNGVAYPILKDADGAVAQAYGAAVTPQFFVIDTQRTLVYAGGFEQPPATPQQCGDMPVPYLAPVLDAVAAGQDPPFQRTQPKGCPIRR